MFIVNKSKTTALAFATALAFSFTSNFAHAQMSGMSEQLAKFGGAMHAVATTCGGITEAQLNDAKQKQQELLAKQGLDKAKFEQIYIAAQEDAEKAWQSMSKDEQDAACEELKQQAGMMLPTSTTT